MKIFLLPGSFNPPHTAHVAIARWALQSGGADEVWVVVSPQNPLKIDEQMATLDDRLAMTRLAFQGVDHTHVTDFEKNLPAPHYTINSVEYLLAKHPTHHFSILCGSDIIAQLPHWHRIHDLEKLITFVEYPRSTTSTLPTFDVSSSAIRSGNQTALPPLVKQYINTHHLYLSHLQRAKQLYADQNFGEAINELELAPEPEAKTLTQIIYNILAFRNTDIYNP